MRCGRKPCALSPKALLCLLHSKRRQDRLRPPMHAARSAMLDRCEVCVGKLHPSVLHTPRIYPTLMTNWLHALGDVCRQCRQLESVTLA